MLIFFVEKEVEFAEFFVHLMENIASNVRVKCFTSLEELEFRKDEQLPNLIFVNANEYGILKLAIPIVLMSDNLALLSEFSSIRHVFAKLSKPFDSNSLSEILEKYYFFEKHFRIQSTPKLPEFPQLRLIAKKGTNFHVLLTQNISFIYTESKVVFAIDKFGDRFILEQSLSDLEAVLNPVNFFRVNRKFIVHIHAIKSFKSSFKGKIALELEHLSKAEVSISQENAQQFRKWIEGNA